MLSVGDDARCLRGRAACVVGSSSGCAEEGRPGIDRVSLGASCASRNEDAGEASVSQHEGAPSKSIQRPGPRGPAMISEKILSHHLQRKAHAPCASIVGSSGLAQPGEQRASVCHARSPDGVGLVVDRGDRRRSQSLGSRRDAAFRLRTDGRRSRMSGQQTSAPRAERPSRWFILSPFRG